MTPVRGSGAALLDGLDTALSVSEGSTFLSFWETLYLKLHQSQGPPSQGYLSVSPVKRLKTAFAAANDFGRQNTEHCQSCANPAGANCRLQSAPIFYCSDFLLK